MIAKTCSNQRHMSVLRPSAGAIANISLQSSLPTHQKVDPIISKLKRIM